MISNMGNITRVGYHKTLNYFCKPLNTEKMKEKQKPILSPEIFKNLKTGKELDDFLSRIYKQGVEALLNAEMDEHLGYPKNGIKPEDTDNIRNGTSNKTLKSDNGDVEINIPRDRNSSFEPVIVPKHKRFSEKIEDVIIGMYSRGMTTRDIEEQIKEIYGVELSETSVSNITAKILENIKQWQERTLDNVYYILWMDGISFKIRQSGKVINKTVYLVIGLNKEGQKEVLGMWIDTSESASFWLSVLTDLKARGVEDVLIASTDNLKGFTEAIKSVFPQAVTQLCVVHQIRNSMRYVVWKDKKEFVVDLKAIYGAATREAAGNALTDFEEKWGSKYAYAIKSWKENWENLTSYFDYPIEIRKIIYTTNVIESLNNCIRKYTKSKSIFPDDQSALKSVYLSIMNVQKKWNKSIRNWGLILSQFLIIFEERCRLKF
jgi:transposase-like protein